MTGPRSAGGFSLITAIFLLVVVAGLVAFVVNIRSVQVITLLYGVQGARAMQAARSGIEWGIYESIVGGSCAASSNFTLPDAELDDFDIEVQCASSVHTEGTTPVTVYRLTAIASAGAYGTLDYVQRRIQATVSIDPP